MRPASQPSVASAVTQGPGPRVWLSDPFCFTPWYSAALAGALRDAGANVRLLAASIAREPDYFVRCGLVADPGPIRWDRQADRWNPSIRKVVRAAAAAANAVLLTRTLQRNEEARPDVLHVQQLPALNHGLSVDFALITMAQRCGIPVVHTVHNLLPHDTGERLLPVYQRLYSMVDHLICHSSDVAEALVRKFSIGAHAITVIPHGPLFEEVSTAPGLRADAHRRLGIAEERPVVLWQGVMAPYKGLDVLLKAWTRCVRQWPCDARLPLLLIVGAGSSTEEHLVRYAAGANAGTVRAEVRYISTGELPFYFRAADVLVYPYRRITTSGALLTGLSYCKPIVASDLIPFRQYLQPHENALLVPPGDDVSLANALLDLLKDIAATQVNTDVTPILQQFRSGTCYADLLGGAGHNHLRYTGWDEIATRTLSVYDRLLGDLSVAVCNVLHTA